MSDSIIAQFPVADVPLPILAGALCSGQLRIANYLDTLERRFAAVEPSVQAFMPEPGRFERLRAEAAELLLRWPSPAGRPSLFGVPIGIKDIMRMDGLPTSGGSRLPVDVLAGPESACVTRLKQAGALIMGKTVTTEFAYFEPGPTRNPHNLEHTPGGSSSGSAAAVAAGLCPLALGTQTVGSVIRPAAFCGVVGFKPSFGRIATAGVIPLSPSVDHVGIFAGDPQGVALAASVLLADWRHARAPQPPVLGIPEGPYLAQAGEEAQVQFRAALAHLRGEGYTVVLVPAMADFEAVRARHNRIVDADAARVHAEWFERYHELYRPRTVGLIERGRLVSPDQLAEALAGREKLRAELLALMDEHSLDLWVAPSAPGPAPIGLESTGDPVMNLPWTHSGLPAINLPMGRAANGLPLGLQFIGRWQADERLLSWAETLQTALAPVSSGTGAP
jgi:Asp-tRNA(Asn)/Glu-tRNA(Gln) amidotransferase A subunit family amidase